MQKKQTLLGFPFALFTWIGAGLMPNIVNAWSGLHAEFYVFLQVLIFGVWLLCGFWSFLAFLSKFRMLYCVVTLGICFLAMFFVYPIAKSSYEVNYPNGDKSVGIEFIDFSTTLRIIEGIPPTVWLIFASMFLVLILHHSLIRWLRRMRSKVMNEINWISEDEAWDMIRSSLLNKLLHPTNERTQATTHGLLGTLNIFRDSETQRPPKKDDFVHEVRVRDFFKAFCKNKQAVKVDGEAKLINERELMEEIERQELKIAETYSTS